MRMGILYYLIFTGICAIIPGIGWLTWIGATLIIIAYNFYKQIHKMRIGDNKQW